MEKIDYSSICNLFAKRCKLCKGSKFVIKNGIDCICPCQLRAAAKWKFEQVEVHPASLKYKDWKDFTGLIGSDKITGTLTIESLRDARNAALNYCFGSSDKHVLDDRRKYLIVHKHLQDGQNVVIVGDNNSGKTLLSTLILKEVAWASVLFSKRIDFKSIHFLDLVKAATWQFDGTTVLKHMDLDYLDDLADFHFLAIDDIDILLRGYNHPPDHIQMDSFFFNRKIRNYPTIFSATSSFMKKMSTNIGDTQHKYGSGFVNTFLNPNNVVINLVVESGNQHVET